MTLLISLTIASCFLLFIYFALAITIRTILHISLPNSSFANSHSEKTTYTFYNSLLEKVLFAYCFFSVFALNADPFSVFVGVYSFTLSKTLPESLLGFPNLSNLSSFNFFGLLLGSVVTYGFAKADYLAMRKTIVDGLSKFRTSKIEPESGTERTRVDLEQIRYDASRNSNLLPSESALLATLTEKFYGSWSFRIIAGALLASVLLAGTGTLLIGDKTIQVTESLDRLRANSENEINAAKEKIDSDLRNQVEKSIVEIKSEITKTVLMSIQNEVDAAHDRIENNLKGIIKQSQELKDDAISKVVSSIESRFNESKSQVNERLSELNRDAANLSKAILASQKKADNISGELNSFESTVSHLNDELQDKKIGINKIRDNMEDIDKTLKSTKLSLEALSGQSEKISTDLSLLRSSLDKHKSDLDAEISRLQDFMKRPPATVSDGSQSMCSGSLSEGKLAQSEWKIIQNALNGLNLGFNLTLDGRPGKLKSKGKGNRLSNTRKAIMSYQSKINETSNGLLTPVQIHNLVCK